MNTKRVVNHFSCGAASAVAAKLSYTKWGATHEIVHVNAYVAEEHPDNRRFLADCEKWLEAQVIVLRDEKYGASTDEVWRRERYIKGQKGAPDISCSFFCEMADRKIRGGAP